MARHYTYNDLIRYHYNETEPEETSAIEQSLRQNTALRQQYESICKTSDMLDQALMEPTDTTVDIIREHSGYFSSLETS